MGNLTELIIAISALKAGEYVLVKASLAGAIVTNTLFMTGAAFLLGGLKYHQQKFSLSNARLEVAMLFLAAFALLVPSAITAGEGQPMPQALSTGIAIMLIVTYGLGLYFTLHTHKSQFGGPDHGAAGEDVWPLRLALAVLGVTTIFVALVSEVFVGTLEAASLKLGLSPAFVGFVVVAMVGAAAEMLTAFAAARNDRLDLSISISFGSATQIALFVAPVLVLLSYVIGPQPMTLQFWPGAVIMIFIATFTAALVTSGGRSAWYLGVLMLMVYAIFALTMFLLPPSEANMTTDTGKRKRVLEPIERLSEILFGLIMVLTFTGSLSVATADHVEVREMLIGALGCNIAWGIIDAIMYLMAAMSERARDHRAVTAIRAAASATAAHAVIRDHLPQLAAETLRDDDLDRIRSAALGLKDLPPRPHLKAEDWRGAFGVFVLVFLSTLPVVVPFVFMTEIGAAMRTSNAIAIGMLAIIGHAYGRLAGVWPLGMAGAMVILGAVLVAATIALGG